MMISSSTFDINKNRHYYTSRCFPPILTKADEIEVEDQLKRLYGEERSQKYHINLEPRSRDLYVRHVKWFECHVKKDLHVLEAGAGTGSFAAMLAEAGYRVTAADQYTTEDLQTLRSKYSTTRGNLNFASLHELRQQKSMFDAIISIDVVEHLLHPDQVIMEWKNMLRPGGSLSIICPNYSGALCSLRLTANFLARKTTWRYKNVLHGLQHSLENLIFNLMLLFTGNPAFVRCMPNYINGKIEMIDSDMDTVHLPSARGLRNFLNANDFELISWRRSNAGVMVKMVGLLLPGMAPTVRLHSIRKPENGKG